MKLLKDTNSNIDGLNMLEPMGLVIWDTAENHVMKWMMELLDPFPLARSLFIAADTELVPRRQVKMGGLTSPNSPPLTACSNQAEKIGIFWRDLFTDFLEMTPLTLRSARWVMIGEFSAGCCLAVQTSSKWLKEHPCTPTHHQKLTQPSCTWSRRLETRYVTMWHLFPLPTICWIVGFVDFISHKISAYNEWLCNCPSISGPNPDHLNLISRYVGMSDGEKSPAMLLLIPQNLK